MQGDNKDHNLHIHLNPQAVNPYPDQNLQGQYVDTVQSQGISPEKALRNLTTRIKTKFGWYTCLVKFEVVMNLVISILAANQAHDGVLTMLIIFYFLIMLGQCGCALEVKRDLDAPMQYEMFIQFIITTIASFGLLVMTGGWTAWLLTLIIPLGIQSLIGLVLVFGSYLLYRLMRDRDNIIMQINDIFYSTSPIFHGINV